MKPNNQKSDSVYQPSVEQASERQEKSTLSISKSKTVKAKSRSKDVHLTLSRTALKKEQCLWIVFYGLGGLPPFVLGLLFAPVTAALTIWLCLDPNTLSLERAAVLIGALFIACFLAAVPQGILKYWEEKAKGPSRAEILNEVDKFRGSQSQILEEDLRKRGKDVNAENSSDKSKAIAKAMNESENIYRYLRGMIEPLRDDEETIRIGVWVPEGDRLRAQYSCDSCFRRFGETIDYAPFLIEQDRNSMPLVVFHFHYGAHQQPLVVMDCEKYSGFKKLRTDVKQRPVKTGSMILLLHEGQEKSDSLVFVIESNRVNCLNSRTAPRYIAYLEEAARVIPCELARSKLQKKCLAL